MWPPKEPRVAKKAGLVRTAPVLPLRWQPSVLLSVDAVFSDFALITHVQVSGSNQVFLTLPPAASLPALKNPLDTVVAFAPLL